VAGLQHLNSVFTQGIQKLDEISLDNSKLQKLIDNTISDFNIYNGPTNEFNLTDLTGITSKDLIQQGTSNINASNLNIGDTSLPTFDWFNPPTMEKTFNTKQSNWSKLYTNEHSNIVNTGYHYSSNVNRDKLNIKFGENPNIINSTAISRASNFSGGGEPYIVSNLSRSDSDGDSGRNINFGSRELPITRAITDVERIGKFLSTPAGLAFIARQQVLGNQGMNIVRSGQIGEDKLIRQRQYKAFYNPLSTVMSVGPFTRMLGLGPNTLVDRLFPVNELIDTTSLIPTEYGIESIKLLTSSEHSKQDIHQVFNEGITGTGTLSDRLENYFDSLINGDEVTRVSSGDPHTLLDIDENVDIKAAPKDSIKRRLGESADKIEGKTSAPYGMPFYFKDLRDGAYITFRAYLDGITENVSPSWEPSNYIGRSEPAYVYTRTERDISFNLKIFAHTKNELMMIYKKLNRLTSLCYPEYKKDVLLDNKTRMKPPLTKFRLGELFGSNNDELIGFIKSLTYSVPDEGVWETEYGKRVPKYITVAINYQVIHAKTPSLDTDFYGYVGETSV
tara:strand:+ start:3428 stop:5110 length:1683 start_codon:yes stop_codon:yes gene_type:complete